MTVRNPIVRRAGIALFVTGMFCLFFRTADRYIGWSRHEKMPGILVHSDGAGYYAYLPEWFIYRDRFEFIRIICKKYPKERFGDGIIWNEKHKLGNKYYCGTAVMLSPFFLAGNLHARVAQEPQDGYSWPYLFWLTIATAFYAAIGLLGLLLTGFRLGFSAFPVWATTILIGTGTNYYFYASGEIPMSHIFSFCLNIWSVYYLLKYRDYSKSSWKIFFFLLAALAIIVRPLNVVVIVVVPFLFDSFPAFRQRIREAFTHELRSTLIAITGFLAILSLQIYNAWKQLGHPGFNLYTAEGFDNWKDPYFWHSLFGFEKGMFIYSPVLLLMIPGMIAGLFYRRYLTIGILLFFLLTAYASSAWWCWDYGGAFGLRALIDFYGIYALAIMLLLARVNKTGRLLLVLPICTAIYLYQVFDYQFRHDIIRYDNMDLNKLRLVFLKTDERFQYIFNRKLDTLGSDFHVKGRLSGMIHPLTGLRVNEFDFKRDHPEELPFVTLYRDDLQHIAGDFAYRMRIDVWLGGTDSFTSMYTKGYSDGREVFAHDNPYCHLPGKIKSWERITIDVDTKYPASGLDSVRCTFSCISTPSKIRRPVIYWGSKS